MKSPQKFADDMRLTERDATGEFLYSIRIGDYSHFKFKAGHGSGEHFIYADNRDDALEKLKMRFTRNGIKLPSDISSVEFEREQALQRTNEAKGIR